jgi:hypothetical protein
MRKLAAALAVVAVAVAVWTAHPPAVSSAPTCDAKLVPPSGTPGDLLLAVAGAPERAVAVGIHYVGGDGRALALQRTSGGWARIRVPVDANKMLVQLQDAATVGATTWGVGTYRNDEPVAGTLKGSTWRWTEPIDPGPLEDEFLGVTATPDDTVWAVGKHETSERNYQPLIERWDGAAWSLVPSPTIPGSAVLKDVVTAPDGTMWAVGWIVGHGGVTVPLVERWNGTAWARVAAPGHGQLSGVAIEADSRPIAVGWRETDAGDEIVTLRETDGRWTTLAGDGDPGRLTAVAAAQSTVAVGLRDDDSGLPTAIAMSYQHGWQPINLGATPLAPGGAQLLGVTGEGGDFLGVGIQGIETGFGSVLATGACGT